MSKRPRLRAICAWNTHWNSTSPSSPLSSSMSPRSIASSASYVSSSRNGRSDCGVCLRSHGQPFGDRSVAMMRTRRANARVRATRARARTIVVRGRVTRAMLHSSSVRVLFLGTGTSHGVPMIGCDCDVCRSTDPRDARSRPSIVIECDDGLRVLVDTTPDLRAQALRHDLRRIDAILFTHSHADHVMGLDEVRRYNMLSRAPMPVYGDAPTLREVRRTFAYIFESDAPKGGGVPDLRLFPIGGAVLPGPPGRAAGADPTRPVEDSRVSVRPVRVPHRLQRHSRDVAGAAAGPRLSGARRAAEAAASRRTSRSTRPSRWRGRSARAGRSSRTSRTSWGTRRRARRCPPGMALAHDGLSSRSRDAGPLLSRCAPAEVADANRGARQLRRRASRAISS